MGDDCEEVSLSIAIANVTAHAINVSESRYGALRFAARTLQVYRSWHDFYEYLVRRHQI